MGRDEERRVASLYNTLSDSYDELYTEEQALKHEMVSEHLNGKYVKTLVDIGSGTGIFLQRAKDTFDYGIGVDLSVRMLQLAKKQKPVNAELVLASAPTLPFRTGSIDCVVSISTAEDTQNVSEFIAEMKRIGTKESIRIATIFESPEAQTVLSLSGTRSKNRISIRESLYVLGDPIVSR